MEKTGDACHFLVADTRKASRVAFSCSNLPSMPNGNGFRFNVVYTGKVG